MNYDSDQDFDREPGGCDGWYNSDEERWCERQLKLQELKDSLNTIKTNIRTNRCHSYPWVICSR